MDAKESPVCLITCADLHLSHQAPIARSCEDWYEVMGRQLRQLRALKEKHLCPHIVCCGDLFDKACPPLQLVNWAIDNLPQMYAVAGNHDLPNHRLEEMDRSAYGTLVKASIIIDLKPGESKHLGLASGAVVLHPFPCGYPVKPLARNSRSDLCMHVAACHEYLWSNKTGHKDAPDSQRLKNVWPRLDGYDVCFFGDNHTPFDIVSLNKGKAKVTNCGGFFRRKIDEKGHRPSVALLHEDGSVTRQYLDVSEDQWLDADQMPAAANDIGFQQFVNELGTLAGTAIDFSEAVHRLLSTNKIPEQVRDFMLAAIENKK